MKILNLKFKNINSLSGENEIDFTQSAFTNEGLFAITGKTGAGKSSILDAISLALYGKTPRVDVTSGENAVMTRGENDCYSEITFEVAGKIWKASWKQERARTGKLKQVERIVADENDTIVADKLSIKGARKNADEKTVDEKIVEIIGLKFEQFTKAIMLAQGSFAAFLQAGKNEKGELLEQITGTEIYAEISKKVFERKGKEAQKLERIAIELEGIKILSDEEISNLKTDNAELLNSKIKIEEELNTLEHSQKILSDLKELEVAVLAIKEKLPELIAKSTTAEIAFNAAKNTLTAIKDEREKQEPIFKKVRELDTKISEKEKLLQPILETISKLKSNQTVLSTKLKEQQLTFEQKQEELLEKQNWSIEHSKYSELVSNYTAIEQESKRLTLLSEEIRQQLETIDALQKEEDAKKIKLKEVNDSFTEKQEKLGIKQEELATKNKELATILGGKEVAELQQEKDTISAFGIEIKNLIDVESALLKSEKDVDDYNNAIKQFSEKIKVLSEKIEKGKENEQNLNERINLLSETITLTKTILSLEQHRHNLKDGEKCPLCGALEHPFALGNIPQLGEKEKELTLLKKQLQELTDAIRTDEKQVVSLESSLNFAVIGKEKEEKNLQENTNKKEDIRSKINEINPNFSIATENAIGQLHEIVNQKRQELKEIIAIIEKASDCERLIARLRDKEIPALKDERDLVEKEKNESETQLKLVNQDINAKQKLVQGDQEIHQKEYVVFSEQLNHYGVATSNDLKKCLDTWIENEQQIEELKLQKSTLDNTIQSNNKELMGQQKIVDEKQKEKEAIEVDKNKLQNERNALFDNESVEEAEKNLKKQFEKAEIEKAETEKQNLELTTELERNKAVLLDKETELAKKQIQKNTSKTIEELQSDIDETKIKQTNLIQRIGANSEKLEFNESQLKKSSEKLAERSKQHEIYQQWNNLSDLIGSSDGKKYRNFAQALTFEHLIGLSNRQLEKMSDRYLLKRTDDKTNPFDLSVIDKFQNNEERTSKNLSGGEKFIISLSLALGLSTMASKNMRIDTMFIDEGFGTLDSEYLDLALSTLSNLQSEGKVIGVISHLTELKERIATHIEVVSEGNGRSRIQIV